MNPIEWMTPLYKHLGANHPVLSTVIIFLVTGGFFAFWWVVVGKEYRESLAKAAPQSIAGAKSQPLDTPASNVPSVKKRGKDTPGVLVIPKASVKPTAPLIQQNSNGPNSPNIAQIGSNNQATVNIGNVQPHLTAEQKAKLVNALRPLAGTKIEVYCYSTDKEGCVYGQEFFAALREAGWNPGIMVGQLIGASPTDSLPRVTIKSRDSKPPGLIEIVGALESIGFKREVMVSNDMDDNELRLTIGIASP